MTCLLNIALLCVHLILLFEGHLVSGGDEGELFLWRPEDAPDLSPALTAGSEPNKTLPQSHEVIVWEDLKHGKRRVEYEIE